MPAPTPKETAKKLIARKVEQLIATDVNIGERRSNVVEAEHGGFYQRFGNAHIYWHSVMRTEAREVHGGILAKYQEMGGFGVSPAFGKRLLGFPLSDETITKDHRCPVSFFEWGAIYWKYGGVALYGDLYKHWKAMGAESSWLGYPLADPIKVADGVAAFFEFGCLWYGSKSNNAVVEIAWSLPSLGQPWVMKADGLKDKPVLGFSFNRRSFDKNAAGQLMHDLFDGRMSLKEVGASVEIPLTFNAADVTVKRKSPTVDSFSVPFSLSGGTALKNRQLYDVCLQLPSGEKHALAPHSIYVREGWQDFKFIHATDLHVSRRLDLFRETMKSGGFPAGVAAFNNYNDNFREFIHYANRLHQLGQLEFIMITGDLVDYVFEDGGRSDSYNNFVFFEQLVRGTAPAPDQEKAAELKVPIFTSLGNHDYRTTPYYMRFDIGVYEHSVYSPAPQFSSSNLIAEEATCITPLANRVISSERALQMIKPDEENRAHNLDFYFKYINPESSYTVKLDGHRIVMIDGKWDDGVTGTLGTIAAKWGFAGEASRNLVSGSPNSVGFDIKEIDRLRVALSSSGLVIVGVHNPLISLKDGEYPYFLRETVRRQSPRAFSAEILRYFSRRGLAIPGSSFQVIPPPGWSITRTPHFATGTGENHLDYAVMNTKNYDFLKLCLGVGSAKPVDLVLSGHTHMNWECRIQWNATKKNFNFLSDFYTENPEVYYHSGDDVRPDGKQIHISVTEEAGNDDAPVKNAEGIWTLKTKPNPTALDKQPTVGKSQSWWQDTRPLFIQTEALGPMKSQRGKRLETQPQPDFRGCRLITVQENTIHRIHYVKGEEITKTLSQTPRPPRPPGLGGVLRRGAGGAV